MKVERLISLKFSNFDELLDVGSRVAMNRTRFFIIDRTPIEE
jgi:hypothetical protein